MDNGVKKPWLSKTLWIGFASGIIGGCAYFFPGAVPIADWITANGGAITMGWGILAMGLRLISKDKIQLVD